MTSLKQQQDNLFSSASERERIKSTSLAHWARAILRVVNHDFSSGLEAMLCILLYGVAKFCYHI